MRRILIFSLVFLSLALASCKDDFDVDKLQDAPRLVVYSFPTVGDTTLIAVAKSIPVASFKGNPNALPSQTVDDAHIIYKVNGVECPVKRIETQQEAQHLTASRNPLALKSIVGQYYAVGKQKEGDYVSVEVSAEGLSPVSASTYIPKKVDVELGQIRFDEKSTDGDSYVDKLEATFQDNASSEDYYFVKVKYSTKNGMAMGIRNYQDGRAADTTYVYNSWDYKSQKDSHYDTWNFDSLYLYTIDKPLLTESEPILSKKSKLNDDFGFDDYEFYDDAYIFNDRMINGKHYTLHLEAMYGSYGYYYDHSYDWSLVFGSTYSVGLYAITPEYYRFLKSINDAQSNSWADVGLMQITPTYSNVKGGFGVVAGYHVSEASRFIAPSGNLDNRYTK